VKDSERYECSVCCYATSAEYKLWNHVELEHKERKMADKAFPRVAKHEDVTCFNCGRAPLADSRKSTYAENRGSFVADCPRCGMHTFYDLA
jgi:hypothetical protein